MTKQVLQNGSSANDGTGDTLRVGAGKINSNFTELYNILGGDSLTNAVRFNATGVEFEGSNANDFETTLTVVSPTADRTITLPNVTGTVTLNAATQTLTNKTLTSPTITTPAITSPVLTTPQINDTSADHQYVFAVSELAADRNVTLPLLAGNDEFTFNAHTQTLTNKTLTSPKIGTSILDVNDNSLIDIVATANANNNLKLTNGANGDAPLLEAVGSSDANVALKLGSKGTSAVEITTPFVLGHESTTGSVAVNKTTTIFTNTSGATAQLPNGNTIGQIKIMLKTGATGTTTISQTGSNFAFGSSIAFAANQSATLIWSGTKWFIISNSGTVA